MLTRSKKSPMPADVAIGVNIRTLRLLRGLSQPELGEAIGVTYQQIQKYEKGANRVGGSRAVQIAAFLGVPVADLYKGLEVGADRGDEGNVFVGGTVQNDQEADLLNAFRRCPPAARQAIMRVAEAARL